MPRLTQIKETKKGRLALFFDGEFAFSLDENTFADAGLHQDDDLEEWKIEELRKNKVKVNGFGYQDPPRTGQGHGLPGPARPCGGGAIPKALP